MKRRAIEEFLEIEETQGTMEAVRIVGEELEMYRITVHHNLFECGNCDPDRKSTRLNSSHRR